MAYRSSPLLRILIGKNNFETSAPYGPPYSPAFFSPSLSRVPEHPASSSWWDNDMNSSLSADSTTYRGTNDTKNLEATSCKTRAGPDSVLPILPCIKIVDRGARDFTRKEGKFGVRTHVLRCYAETLRMVVKTREMAALQINPARNTALCFRRCKYTGDPTIPASRAICLLRVHGLSHACD